MDILIPSLHHRLRNSSAPQAKFAEAMKEDGSPEAFERQLMQETLPQLDSALANEEYAGFVDLLIGPSQYAVPSLKDAMDG